MAARKREQTIFFPWERRGGILKVPWLRSRVLLACVGMGAVLLWFGMEQKDDVGVRSTRATMLVVREALDAYRADHEGRCPPSLASLGAEGYLEVDPLDAWNRPLVLTCPGRKDPASYDLVSYGANGDMRGLERVE